MTSRNSMILGERLAVVDGHYGSLFTIQQKSPINENMSSVTISDEELRQIVEFRGLKLAPESDAPTRENDVRVALMQSLNTATSMLKQAVEQGVAPNTLIDDDLFKMFIATFEETTERASREINQ